MEIRIAVAVPCYKRPFGAAAYLQSLATCPMAPFIEGAFVYLQPPRFYEHIAVDDLTADVPFRVIWQEGRQRAINDARKAAAYGAMAHYCPKANVVMIADDDMLAMQHTVLTPLMQELLQRKDTGLVTLMRWMGKKSPARRNPELSMPLNGGGMLIRVDVLQAHGDEALQEDGSDERQMGLTLYLAGYRNYNTGESYAIHKVGTKEGGMHQLYRDAVAGEGVTVEPPTRFGPEHPYLQGEIRSMSQYAGKGLGSTRFKTYPKLTAAAHALHKQNNALLLAGEG